MAHLKYRTNPVEFHSNFDKEDVIRAEQVLMDNGIDVDEVDSVLQAVCYTLFDLEVYDEEYDEDGKVMEMPWDYGKHFD